MLNILIAIFLTSAISDSIQQFKIKDEYVRVLGFELEQDKLENIQCKIASTKVFQSGDASSAETRINYYLRNENVYIVFASGEMGGGQDLTDVTMVTEIPEEAKTIDTKLNQTDFCGVRIGDSRQQVEKKLGIKVTSDTLRFDNELNVKIRDEDFTEIRSLPSHIDNMAIDFCLF
jgi:hypothetical protein